MISNLIAIAGGLALLVWGADRFITGAAALANNLGVPPLMVGLTVVGFGTSAPEMLVSGTAAFQGTPGLAIGNAIGSNIANVGLILGASALLRPLSVHSAVLKREYPVLLAISVLTLVLMLDGNLGRVDGMLLLACLGAFLYWTVTIALVSPETEPMASEYAAEIPSEMPTTGALIRLAVGLAALLVSSRALVWGASNVAAQLGVSDLVIGLTIVAVGTSLPELAAGITSAVKGQDDIAIGNIIGSNLFNLLAVLSLPAIIAPGPFEPAVLSRDLPVMLLFTLAIFFMGYGFWDGQRRINRLEGLTLLLAFIAYQSWLYFDLSQTATQ